MLAKDWIPLWNVGPDGLWNCEYTKIGLTIFHTYTLIQSMNVCVSHATHIITHVPCNYTYIYNMSVHVICKICHSYVDIRNVCEYPAWM